MKSIKLTSLTIGLIQAAGVIISVLAAIGFLSATQWLTPDPVGLMLIFCSMATIDLFIVLFHPLQLISAGKGKQALDSLRWTLLWLVTGTVIWVVVLQHFLPHFNLID